MTRLLLLLLIFGSSLVASAETGKDMSSVEISEEDVDDNEVKLTKAVCLEARILKSESFLLEHCCDVHYDHDDALTDCYKAYKPTPHNELKDISKLAECTYIKKKFTKGQENLNFNRIKAAVNKLPDLRERKYTMDMYRMCNDMAKLQLKALKDESPGQNPMGLRRPFYTLVFLCVSTFSTVSCPYFRWQGLSGGQRCVEYANKCRELLKESEQ